MAGMELLDLRKSFGSVDVIQGVSIDIADGEFVVLVGPSGCGKSTLLRMIAGLEPVSGGEVRIGGRRVNNVSPMDRDIAMVFQNYALYPHMNVARNMGFSLMLRGVPKEEIGRRVAQAAEILGLAALLDRYPRELSGGQRQRVAMGRAIVRDPQVFLFDEPLSNLDAKLRIQMRAEIKTLHQSLKTTIVYVTHDQVEGMSLADKIVVMNEGRIRQIGRPLDVYDRPTDIFVAGFIGSPAMNFLPGRVSADATHVEIAEGARFPLSVPAAAHAGREVVYGIRPEHLEIDGSRGVPASVVVVEPTGSDTFVLAGIGGRTVTATFHDRINLERGETIPLAPQHGASHLFDSATGLRLNLPAAGTASSKCRLPARWPKRRVSRAP